MAKQDWSSRSYAAKFVVIALHEGIIERVKLFAEEEKAVEAADGFARGHDASEWDIIVWSVEAGESVYNPYWQ